MFFSLPSLCSLDVQPILHLHWLAIPYTPWLCLLTCLLLSSLPSTKDWQRYPAHPPPPLTSTLDSAYNSPGIGDNKLLCKASLYLNLIKPNNSLPLIVLDPLISTLLHLNQTNQLINQTTSRSHLLLAQEKLSNSMSVIRSAWAPIIRFRTVLTHLQKALTWSHCAK